MAIITVTKDDVENFTVVTTPRRHYVSSSSGVTGSVRVFPRQSQAEKDTVVPTTAFADSDAKVDSNFVTTYGKVVDTARTLRAASHSITSSLSTYMDLVSSASLKRTNILTVERFTPTPSITPYTLTKNNVKDVLMPFYRAAYPHAHWAYTNYNALNFFAAPTIPTASVLLYPNVEDAWTPAHSGHVSGSYCMSGAFSFDFRINPRYKTDSIDPGHFKAGTIFHLSSSYALSLVTGSAKDGNGLPVGFRLQLQLSQSADIDPSLATHGPYPRDLVFLSDDNSLSWNNWHHAVVRWGSQDVSYGTGSFVIDGITRGTFVVPSASISPKQGSGRLNPDVLCVGNYYTGENLGTNAQALFFATAPAVRDGVYEIYPDAGWDSPAGFEGPDHYRFNHPLKAEVHDLAIKRYYVSDNEIKASGSYGLGLIDRTKVSFYVPPFFVEETPIRRFVKDHGGILQTPFFEVNGTTDDPFNVAMAFGVQGHYINLENFTKDFVTGRFPRLMQLSASTIDYTTDAEAANNFIYNQPQAAKRNYTVVPCDDGNFDPNYDLLNYERLQNKFVDPNGSVDMSYINLDGLLSLQSLSGSGMGQSDPQLDSYINFETQLYGASPETPGLPAGQASATAYAAVTAAATDEATFDRGVQKDVPLTIFRRLLDPSSDQVTFFNISNLYYGRRILPGSFVLTDSAMSGSGGAVSFTVRDDKMGNLYRGDSYTPLASQNSVGNIFYDEGLVVLKSPHLYQFGKDGFEMTFQGVYNIYTTKYEILAPSGMLNSSSNPTYLENSALMRPSDRMTDNENFVYISGMYLHDENMNVVGKVKMAQPIMKRETAKILFKCTMDY